MSTMVQLVSGLKKYRQFIGGEWIDSTNKAFTTVENPANEEIVAKVPEGSEEDAE